MRDHVILHKNLWRKNHEAELAAYKKRGGEIKVHQPHERAIGPREGGFYHFTAERTMLHEVLS